MYKRWKKTKTLLLAWMMMIFLVGTVSAQEAVDWEKGSITVVGMGVAPPNAVNQAHARMMARRAAVADGYRQLAENIKGVNVNAETTVENMMVTSDVVNTKVSACIKGAQVISERMIPGGGYEVTMVVPLFGVSDSLASAVLERPAVKEPFPIPTPNVMPSPPPSTTVNVQVSITQNAPAQTAPSVPSTYNPYNSYRPYSVSSGVQLSTPYSSYPTYPSYPSYGSTDTRQGDPSYGGQYDSYNQPQSTGKENVEIIGDYTSLVIDCTGLGLQPAMSPVIQNEKGEAIYGAKNLDFDVVVTKGMASYIRSFEQLPKVSRTGNKPLILKGTSLERNSINPVITIPDSNRVLLENEKSHFLDNLNVIFLR